MEKIKRTDRLVLLTNLLTRHPNVLFSLTELVDLTGAAKSTISEDLTIVKEVLSQAGWGEIISLAGAAGGVKYHPIVNGGEIEGFLRELAGRLSTSDRIMAGGFIYMTDLIYNPMIITRIGEIFFSKFRDTNPDYVVTMETKGIPLAMLTAKVFNVPLVIVRDESGVTEGSTVSINYVSGSTRRIQTMSLARRALPSGCRVLIIDDFMKAGGTARGMKDLMREFNAEVVGIGVVVATKEPKNKLVDEYFSLLELSFLDEERKEIVIHPA